MTLRDTDLVSIQEARELAARAAAAQRLFASASQPQVDALVEACAKAALDANESLARLAVEETGYGNVPDKMTKNRLAAVHVPRAIRAIKTVGIVREDAEKAIVEIATPVGVVAAIIPCTNPTSTAIYKTLISIKARNAIVLSPHPSAVKCIRATADVMARAAMAVGAPEGLIACMSHATMQGTQELWRQRDVGVILATGGAGLVRAAYASGKPAYGVGPGNVPAYIERTANVHKAVADILAGKTFDYGTICSSEQAIVCDEAIAEQVLAELRAQNAHILSEEDAGKVGAMVFKPGAAAPNPQIVGRPATMLAQMAGISVLPQTRALIARQTSVGREHPLSAEKLSPILALYVVKNSAEAFDLCQRLLRFGGAGHTASVHTQTESIAKAYGAAVPAFRIVVNSSAVHGSIGYSTNLFPAMTLGCGAAGGNITSDNIGPQHLMNLKRVAWESRPIEHRTVAADRRMIAESGGATVASNPGATGAAGAGTGGGASVGASFGSPSGSSTTSAQPSAEATGARANPLPDRATIARAVGEVMQRLGISRGSGVGAGFSSPSDSSHAAPSASHGGDGGLKPAPTVAATITPAEEIAARIFGATGAGMPTHIPAAQSSSSAQTAPGSSAASGKSKSAADPPAPPAPKAVDFVSESDVRQAVRKGEKIVIGPKTIVTPAARDLANDHGVFIETKPRS